MRTDKFLKVSRLVLRREVAKKLCDDGDIILNGKPAKPSSEISPGDTVVLLLGKRKVTVTIKEIRPFASKQDASSLYEIISDESTGGNPNA